jgi:hypothetical protein
MADATDDGGRLPQPTEEVHLPDPSYLPVVLSVGVTIALIGITLAWWIVLIGVVVVVIVLYKWIVSARQEMRELPLEH